MKKYIAFSLIFLCLGAFSRAQGTKTTLFDVVKSQQELEIMRQILGTTLSFVVQNLQTQQATTKVNTPFGAINVGRDIFRVSNISAFYLYGQGAVFVLPASSLRYGDNYRLASTYFDQANMQLQNMSEEMNALARENAELARERTTARVQAATAQSAQPKPVPEAKAAQASQEELRKKLAEAQDRVKKSRAEAEANQAKFMASLGEIKSYLIEALATHGDSLNTVKPNEYITLVITLGDSGDSGWLASDGSGIRTRQEIVSVQKSSITDYKAGRITMEAFKQKALQYAQ
jgi:hypothetical protein